MYSSCASDGATGCVATSTYAAALTTGAANKILSGQTLAGVNGNITLPATSVVRSTTSYGVGGNGLTGAISDCSANGSDSCYLNSSSSYDAADLTNLSAGNIKRGISIAGTTGNFPSSTSPLPRYANNGSSTATTGSDLTDLTLFSTQLTSNGSFEFWDANGQRYTGSGDSDLIAANVSNGTNLENLSIVGNYNGPYSNCTGDGQTSCITTTTYKSADTTAITAWDLRYGKSFGGYSGSLKASCRNRVKTSEYNTDTMPPENFSLTGTTVDWWDTLDNSGNPTEQPSGWGAANYCDVELFTDLTADGTCDSAGDDCMIKDNVSGLIWSEVGPSPGVAATDAQVTWQTAVENCYNLNYGGITDWRVPTQFEMTQAYANGISRVFANNGNLGSVSWQWSATSPGWASSGKAWLVNMGAGYVYDYAKTLSYRFQCVTD